MGTNVYNKISILLMICIIGVSLFLLFDALPKDNNVVNEDKK